MGKLDAHAGIHGVLLGDDRLGGVEMMVFMLTCGVVAMTMATVQSTADRWRGLGALNFCILLVALSIVVVYAVQNGVNL